MTETARLDAKLLTTMFIYLFRYFRHEFSVFILTFVLARIVDIVYSYTGLEADKWRS